MTPTSAPDGGSGHRASPCQAAETVIYLLRHGETDWSQVNGRHWIGLANDLAPLTDQGRQQAADAALRIATLRPAVLLTSPMTRALETAGIISRRVGIDPIVNIDLREWLPDEGMAWSSFEEVQVAYAAMIEGAGADEGPSTTPWETLAEVRSRALRALLPFMTRDDPVVAVCHEVLIHALTGCARTAHCQIRALPAHEKGYEMP